MTASTSNEKRCPKCKEIKSHEAFSKNRTEKDGYQSHCKACQAKTYAANAQAICERQRAYKKANAEAIRQQKRAYRAANSEDISEKKRAYRAANVERIQRMSHIYYLNNIETILARTRSYYKNNAEVIRQRQRTKYKNNVEASRERQRVSYASRREAFPDLTRAKSQRRRARKKGNGGNVTAAQLNAMRITQAGVCAYCERQLEPDDLTIDHIIPLDQGGPHIISNICLACDVCNKSKGNRTPEQWTDRWYLRKAGPVVDRRRKNKKHGDQNLTS